MGNLVLIHYFLRWFITFSGHFNGCELLPNGFVCEFDFDLEHSSVGNNTIAGTWGIF